MSESKSLGYTFGLIIAGFLIFFGIVYIEYALYNLIVPKVFGLNEMSYWQMCGLFTFVRIMFYSEQSRIMLNQITK